MKQTIRILISFCICAALAGGVASASDWRKRSSEFSILNDPTRERSSFEPVLSFFIPGVSQYMNGQTGYGLAYTGSTVLGVGLILKTDEKALEFFKYNHGLVPGSGPFIVGEPLIKTSQGVSMYHSFRSVVRSRPQDFSFITAEDSVRDVLLAPFDFRFLTKPTTFIPLAIGAALHWYIASVEEAPEKWKRQLINSTTSPAFRAAGTGLLSYGAGVGEEAMFRGYLQPALHQGLGNRVGANFIQAILFGAAHGMPGGHLPWAQTLLGGYWGYLAEKNGYSIRETIFIHHWWDVIAFGTHYFASIAGHDVTSMGPVSVPLLDIAF